MSLLEEQRFLHEDVERLEAAVADRLLQDPQTQRQRLRRDHEVATFVKRIQEQSSRLKRLYDDTHGQLAKELQALATGDGLEDIRRRVNETREFHQKYPNTQVENLERAYKPRIPGEGEVPLFSDVDSMFTGEEAYGKFFDLTEHHEQFLNLPGIKGGRRVTYLQYLSLFDVFTPPQCPVKKSDKTNDEYLQYVGDLASYLEGFMRRSNPLEDHDSLFTAFDNEFDKAWENSELPGWKDTEGQSNADAEKGSVVQGTGEGIWCPDCEKEFKNDAVYKSHLNGKKHIRAVEAKKEGTANGANGASLRTTNGAASSVRTARIKERAIASREFRVKKLSASMQTIREDTRVNVERRQGMTERERQQEHEALLAEADEPTYGMGNVNLGEDEEDEDDRIYNPLKLPLAWDGKPIPFWLYKLHGLGVEFPCEICGNFVYMGRRAFDKHFNEARHIYGLKCLGITNTTLFREITSIQEASNLWNKIQEEKKGSEAAKENVVEMEDSEGHVMPEKVFYDLQKQGLI